MFRIFLLVLGHRILVSLVRSLYPGSGLRTRYSTQSLLAKLQVGCDSILPTLITKFI